MTYNELFTEALRLFDEGNLPAAEDRLRQITEASPDNPDVLNMLGLIAQGKGLHEEACSYFAAAVRNGKENAGYYYNLAFSQKALQKYNEALRNYTKVLSLAPDVRETYDEIAQIYENLGDLATARNYWDRAISLAPDYAEAMINRANSYRFDNVEYAFEQLTDLAEKYPNNVLVWYDLCWIAYNKQDYESAFQYIEKAEKISSDYDSIQLIKGLIYEAKGQINEARAAFAQAESLNGNNLQAKFHLANILSRQEDYNEAEIRYKKLAEITPNEFAIHNNYAEMMYRQKRLAEALEEYRKAVIINPQSAEVCNNIGLILKDMGEYEEALGLFFNALKLDETQTAISLNISECLILLSRNDEKKALDIANNWVKSYPDSLFARHIQATMKGDNLVDNKVYTEKLFDNFADNYELVMQNLEYTTPLAIRRIIGNYQGRIVDLGCGSGLVGEALKALSNYIIGVDISSQMLKKAKAKQVYQELIKSDICDFLRLRSDYDIIIAADVLVYFGDLAEFINLCRGKRLIFSLEIDNDIPQYQVQKNGRFKHNSDYINKMLHDNGFSCITMHDEILRYENGSAVNGIIFEAF